MTTLPNLNLTLPTRGAPGSGLWGDTEDSNLALLDAHDHSSGKGVRIKTAGISIDADLSFSSLYAPTALNRITFSSVAALSSNNKSLFVSDADNELYWRSNAGANVKLTSGSSLNVAAFTGGIGGDYTAVSASVQYDDANKRYTFKQGGGTTWAKLHAGGLRLSELGTNETVFVEQIAPSALAVSYTMTWPLATPGSTQLAQIDSTGQWSFSNTVVSNATFSGTLTSTGLVTATAGVTCGASQHVTVSGAGIFKHGTKTLSLAAAAFVARDVQFSVAPVGSAAWSTALQADIYASITLPVGARILAIRAFIKDSLGSPTKIQASLVSLTNAGTSTTIASSSVSAGNQTNQTLTVSPSATTIASSTGYSIRLSITTGADTVTAYGAEVDYDQP
jgi:hypothetical protein